MSGEALLSRRGLLGALICAPAVIRVAPLMQIKVWDTYGPNGLLTMQMITDEMFKMLQSAGATPMSQLLEIRGLSQRHVYFHYKHSDRQLSLESFSERILKPAARTIVGSGAKKIGSPPELPKGVWEAAVSAKGGFGVRGVSDYSIATDSIITRFDVTHN